MPAPFRYFLNLWLRYSHPPSLRSTLISRPLDFSARTRYPSKAASAPSFVCCSDTLTHLLLSSIKGIKYISPHRPAVCIGPHRSEWTTSNIFSALSRLLVPASLCCRPIAHIPQILLVFGSSLLLTSMSFTLDARYFTDTVSSVRWQSLRCHVASVAVGDWLVIRPRFAVNSSRGSFLTDPFAR